MSNPLLREAVELARAGRRQEARDLFIRLVTLDEENEVAWLWLVDLVDDREDKIIALENLLTLNPDNEKARLRLRQIQASNVPTIPPADDLDQALTTPGRDLVAVARRYEAAGDLENAAIVYEQMMAMAEKKTRKSWARQKRAAVLRQIELQEPVPVHTTFTLLRLSLGPVFLYLLLLVIQAAYRPWRASPLAYLGSIAVFAGSLLLVGSLTTPHHPGWTRLLGAGGLRSGGRRLLLGILGAVLMTIPYLSFLALAFQRLQNTPAGPLPGGG